MKKFFLVFTALFCLVAAGCASDNKTINNPSEPNKLEVTLNNPLKQSIPNVKSTTIITDQATVEKVYTSLLAIKGQFPNGSGVINCPMDRGVVYHLIFLNGQTKILEANVDPGGCSSVSVNNGEPKFAMGKEGDAFFAELSKAMGVSESQLGGF